MNLDREIKVKDKYSGEILGNVTLNTDEEITSKINLAKTFFEIYRYSEVGERKQHLNVLIDLLKENREMLSKMIAQEAGKPLFYAKGELDRCIRTAQLGLEYFDELSEQDIAVDLSGTNFHQAKTKRFPSGVIFGISPFNFPLNLALHKIIPALASGNVILIKPSPYTPLSLHFLIEKANLTLPKGLLTIVHCSNEQAEQIVKHPDINLVSFTGSDKVGWHIKSLVPKKKTILELGGNAAVYVHQDANVEGLAEEIAKATCLYAGQICISTQRIFVHEAIYAEFKKDLITYFEKISSGDPMKDVINGPLIDIVHLDRLIQWVNEAKTNGANLLVGGNTISYDPPVLAPTLIENVALEDKLFQSEAFGPVGVLYPVKNHQEAIRLINNSDYGLQAGIFAQDQEVITACYEQIEAGGIIINGVPGFRRDEMPYGGIKSSGFGREGVRYAMEEMTELKLMIS